MKKRAFLVAGLMLVAVLCLRALPHFAATAAAGPWEACSTSAYTTGGCYVACPQGDGTSLSAINSTIYVVCKDFTGTPIPNIPATDFWLIGCSDALILCGGSGAIDADQATNSNGETTISGQFAAGGCGVDGVNVVVQGWIITDPDNCSVPYCLPVQTTSPDITGNGGVVDRVVDIIDLAAFSAGYTASPKPYDGCIDYNCDDLVDIIDFSIFAQHYLHNC